MTTAKNTLKEEEISKDIKASKAAVMWRRQPTTFHRILNIHTRLTFFPEAAYLPGLLFYMEGWPRGLRL